MRNYKEIKKCVQDIQANQPTIVEADLYEISTTLIDCWNEYEEMGSIESTRKQDLLVLMDSLLDKFDSIRKIYQTLQENATTKPYEYNYEIDRNPMDLDRSLIEEVMERVHMQSGLRRHDNEVHNIFRETLGWYFNELDSVEQVRSFLLKNATGAYLDEYAYQYGLARNDNETDDELRARIYAHKKELFKVSDVKSTSVDLFTYVDNPYTQMTSKNTYLSHKYLAHANKNVEDYWFNRYITWREVEWF